MEGKNTEPVSISATIDSTDISSLAKAINQFSSQTGLQAINTSDFDQIIIESKDGYDIGLTEITGPSDFNITSLGEDFISLTDPLLIDVISTNKNSAHIKGNFRFSSSLSFSNQIDAGLTKSATLDPLSNSFIDVQQSSSGETAVSYTHLTLPTILLV